MKISEIFYSVQGEGVWAGVPMAFIRLQGCPFQCLWCDSRYTWDPKGGVDLEVEDVLGRIAAFPTKHVCITGGEPLAQPRALRVLANELHAQGYWIEVETSGGYPIPWDAPVDSWVMDVKCPGSGMERFNRYEGLSRMRPQDQLKLVVADRADFDFAAAILARYQPKCHVLFSPVWGEVDLAALTEWIKAEAPQARLSLQIHKVIWEPTRRGV